MCAIIIRCGACMTFWRDSEENSCILNNGAAVSIPVSLTTAGTSRTSSANTTLPTDANSSEANGANATLSIISSSTATPTSPSSRRNPKIAIPLTVSSSQSITRSNFASISSTLPTVTAFTSTICASVRVDGLNIFPLLTNCSSGSSTTLPPSPPLPSRFILKGG